MELRNYLLIVFFTLRSRFLKDLYVAGSKNESDPSQLYIKQGGEAVLQCMYESERLEWIVRQKGNVTWTAIASGKYTINDTKYKVSTKPSTVLYSRLHVLNTQPGDELIYRCTAGLDKTDFIQLNLYAPPSSLYFVGSINNTLDGREGTDLLIRCIAVGGKPPPDVSILDGNRPSNTQEVSHRIPMISREYHQKSIVCQATSDALDNPMSLTVQIYLNLKPLTPIFNTIEVSTEETVPLRVSCTSYGSRPAASFTWTIGGNDVTSSSATSQTVTESNDTYTVTSIMTSSVNKTHNKQSILCQSSNTVGSVSASKILNVNYAPDMTVTSPAYTQNNAIRTVTCNASGNPDSYTYHKWLHKSKYGEIIREFDGYKTLKLPNVPQLLRYQDTGEYVCTASNGIKDKDNKFERTGSGYVTVNAQPVFTSDINERVNVFGEINKDVDIYINVYSLPNLISFEWTRNGKPIKTQNSTKYKSSSSPTIVYDYIHGIEVQLDGYNVTLTIQNLTTEDFTIYTVTLENELGAIIYPIILQSSNVPETPGNFSMIKPAAKSLTVQWDPHSGGGYKQLFYIQYKVQEVLEWTTVLVGEEDINESKRRRTYELRNLQEGKAYELRMYAENTAGKRSNVTDVLIDFTVNSETSISSALIGAVIGAFVTLVIVCSSVIVIMLFKWRKGKNKTKKKDKCNENTSLEDIQKGVEYDEVGNTRDAEHKQSSETYESLGTNMTKDVLNLYDDLENPQGVTSSKSTLGHYEALGVQEKPSMYDEIRNQKEQRQLRQQQAGKTQLKPSNNATENIELNALTGPI